MHEQNDASLVRAEKVHIANRRLESELGFWAGSSSPQVGRGYPVLQRVDQSRVISVSQNIIKPSGYRNKV